MAGTDEITAEVPAVKPEPVKPEPVRAEATRPGVPEPEGSLADQAAEDSPVNRATYDARLHAALPGVDVRGSYVHRPVP